MVAQRECCDKWDAVIGQIGVVSQNLRSFLGVVELTGLCAFECTV